MDAWQRTIGISGFGMLAVTLTGGMGSIRTGYDGPTAMAMTASHERNSSQEEERRKAILDIAAGYHAFTAANPSPQWAIALCRAPTPAELSRVALRSGGIASGTAITPSRSQDRATHGKKLYTLWVKDMDAYTRVSSFDAPASPGAAKAVMPDPSSPIGQTLVKETFESVDVPSTEAVKKDKVVIMDGPRAVRQGDASELFIMTKVDPKTPDTDSGWIYAIVSADRKTVIRAGQIESCIGCHERTTRDRLYGPEETWPLDENGKHTLPVAAQRGAPARTPDKLRGDGSTKSGDAAAESAPAAKAQQ